MMQIREKFCEIYESKLEERELEVIHQDKLKLYEHNFVHLQYF